VARELNLPAGVDHQRSLRTKIVRPVIHWLCGDAKSAAHLEFVPRWQCVLPKQKTRGQSWGRRNHEPDPRNGSNEIIELSPRIAETGDDIGRSRQFCSRFIHCCQNVWGKRYHRPASRYGHDLPAMLKAITPKNPHVFVGEPEQSDRPRWRPTTEDVIPKFVNDVPDDVLLVMDEAYIEFWTMPWICSAHPPGHPQESDFDAYVFQDLWLGRGCVSDWHRHVPNWFSANIEKIANRSMSTCSHRRGDCGLG